MRLAPRARRDLERLVALPSVHDGSHVPACSAAADLVVELFTEVGVADSRRVPTDDGSDAVVGFAPGPEGAPTVLLYSHYDVQPVEPEQWTSSPWELSAHAVNPSAKAHPSTAMPARILRTSMVIASMRAHPCAGRLAARPARNPCAAVPARSGARRGAGPPVHRRRSLRNRKDTVSSWPCSSSFGK